MNERNGVRIGQPVRDLDGKRLGRVAALYEHAFLVGKGPPILFRQEQVVPYEEVRGERDGALLVSRSDRQLFELAEGEMPATWRVPVPPGFPAAATPGEARGVFAEVALGHAVTGEPLAAGLDAFDRGHAEAEVVRAFQRSRGEVAAAPPPGA